MIDLSNKTEEEVNALMQKYISVLQLVSDKQQAPYFAAALDCAVNYLNENYQDLSSDWKTWAIVVVKGFYHNIRNEATVKRFIDDFVEYYRTQYQAYIDNVNLEGTISATEYDRDSRFVFTYINNGGKQ